MSILAIAARYKDTVEKEQVKQLSCVLPLATIEERRASASDSSDEGQECEYEP